MTSIKLVQGVPEEVLKKINEASLSNIDSAMAYRLLLDGPMEQFEKSSVSEEASERYGAQASRLLMSSYKEFFESLDNVLGMTTRPPKDKEEDQARASALASVMSNLLESSVLMMAHFAISTTGDRGAAERILNQTPHYMGLSLDEAVQKVQQATQDLKEQAANY